MCVSKILRKTSNGFYIQKNNECFEHLVIPKGFLWIDKENFTYRKGHGVCTLGELKPQELSSSHETVTLINLFLTDQYPKLNFKKIFTLSVSLDELVFDDMNKFNTYNIDHKSMKILYRSISLNTILNSICSSSCNTCSKCKNAFYFHFIKHGAILGDQFDDNLDNYQYCVFFYLKYISLFDLSEVVRPQFKLEQAIQQFEIEFNRLIKVCRDIIEDLCKKDLFENWDDDEYDYTNKILEYLEGGVYPPPFLFNKFNVF